MSAAPSRIRAATRADLPGVVDLLIAGDVAQAGQPDTTAEDVESDWTMDGFDLARDAWVAVDDGGGLVGYAYTGDQSRTGEFEADFWVHPESREPRLAARLLNLTERRARDLARRRGYGADAALDVFCIGVDRAKRDLLVQHGFRLKRTVYRMAADLSDGVTALPAPAGVEIRPFRRDADESVMFATMSEAYAEHFRQSDEPFEAWKTRLLGHGDFDPGLWFIAWDGDEAAGGAIACDYGDLGWVKGLGIRRPWRRRGLGGALLTSVFAELARRGRQSVELGVDAEGETQPLRPYERAGMRVTFTYALLEKPLTG